MVSRLTVLFVKEFTKAGILVPLLALKLRIAGLGII